VSPPRAENLQRPGETLCGEAARPSRLGRGVSLVHLVGVKVVEPHPLGKIDHFTGLVVGNLDPLDVKGSLGVAVTAVRPECHGALAVWVQLVGQTPGHEPASATSAGSNFEEELQFLRRMYAKWLVHDLCGFCPVSREQGSAGKGHLTGKSVAVARESWLHDHEFYGKKARVSHTNRRLFQLLNSHAIQKRNRSPD